MSCKNKDLYEFCLWNGNGNFYGLRRFDFQGYVEFDDKLL